MNEYCVLTTINLPTKAIEKLYEPFGSNLIVVGDVKTPKDWNYKDTTFISVDRIDNKGWHEGYDPINHYARKNIGYLEAIKRGANVIYSTDDDNIPNDKWEIRSEHCIANEVTQKGWYNVYDILAQEFVWPRGFSLKNIRNIYSYGDKVNINSSIQQGLADKDPDVDAIWRLTLKEEILFQNKHSLYLHPFSWCPFNSQSTWFFPDAYPLMYLPVYANFRCTDIWGSFVAQRCLWEMNDGITFHSPSEVYQDRNEHDLIKDFKDEIPGYLHNDEIVEILTNLKLREGKEHICENMLTCYQAIVDKGILPEMEIRSLKSWVKEYEKSV